MKKPKFLIKIDRNNLCKVYFNHKWQDDVSVIDFHGEPWEYSIDLQQYKRDSKGRLFVENNEVAVEHKHFKIGRNRTSGGK